MQKFTVTKNEADQRLDKYLTKKFPSLPASMLYKGIRKKRIKQNGKRAEISSILKEGDIIELYINDEFLVQEKKNRAFLSITPSLDIIYEDQNLLLINKPIGTSMHEDEKSGNNNLVSHLLAYLYNKGEYAPDSPEAFTPAFCNRLDKNTGGIVIGAKNAMALRIINEKIRSRELEKKYLCLVSGVPSPEEGLLVHYHKKDTSKNKALIFATPRPDYKEIKTGYKVLKSKNGLSLVEAELFTGKFHQIRAQFAFVGHPLIGDVKYGYNKKNTDPDFKYQALYSHKLKFCFSSECELDYLNGKTFTAEKIDFARDF